MTIKINDQKIKFGDYTMSFANTGFVFDGRIIADEFKVLNPPSYGTVSGYATGGVPGGGSPSPTGGYNTGIEKFPFASDTNATFAASLTQARRQGAGQSSQTHGYISGGFQNGDQATIERFPFAVDATAVQVGSLPFDTEDNMGHSSTLSGYSSGGRVSNFPSPPAPIATINKFPFAGEVITSFVGNLFQARESAQTHSSADYGYTSGGIFTSPFWQNTIDKFPFASDGNATDVGDIFTTVGNGAGQASLTNGYGSGEDGTGVTNILYKFSFASDGNATDIGDLTVRRSTQSGQSSTTSGYNSGGNNPSPGYVNVIDKFPFASDGNATDVGDLTIGSYGSTGQQD